jgi:hypothetical protein
MTRPREGWKMTTTEFFEYLVRRGQTRELALELVQVYGSRRDADAHLMTEA